MVHQNDCTGFAGYQTVNDITFALPATGNHRFAKSHFKTRTKLSHEQIANASPQVRILWPTFVWHAHDPRAIILRQTMDTSKDAARLRCGFGVKWDAAYNQTS
jgi:hypothetical protein